MRNTNNPFDSNLGGDFPRGGRQRNAMPKKSASTAGVVAIVAMAAVWLFSPSHRQGSNTTPTHSPGQPTLNPLPQTPSALCTAVVVLVDSSGSMKDSVPAGGGQQRPKHLLAADALRRIIDYTAQWQPRHPETRLQLIVYTFSDKITTIIPPSDFDAAKARKALDLLMSPHGGTALGTALDFAFRALYETGCTRKHVICITDGENTVGPKLDVSARQLYKLSGGDVQLHFVAFDTAAAQFAFLPEVNGYVVEAANGEQLDARLTDIYEKRILAEQMPEDEQTSRPISTQRGNAAE